MHTFTLRLNNKANYPALVCLGKVLKLRVVYLMRSKQSLSGCCSRRLLTFTCFINSLVSLPLLTPHPPPPSPLPPPFFFPPATASRIPFILKLRDAAKRDGKWTPSSLVPIIYSCEVYSINIQHVIFKAGEEGRGGRVSRGRGEAWKERQPFLVSVLWSVETKAVRTVRWMTN